MIQYNGRIEVNDGIRFYEQDMLYDDYLYSGDIDITLNIDYANPGFGIALIDNEGNSIINSKALIFKLGSGIFEIIEKDTNNNTTILFSTSVSVARPYKENLLFKISKRDNIYSFTIGSMQLKNLSLSTEINNYIIGYYSNSYNIIKAINIAAAIPYDWTVNMINTKGGYIFFKRDGFSLSNCQRNAEVEQLNIKLERGKYFLKFDKEKDSDIVPYVMFSNDDRLSDTEKNLLNRSNSFELKETSNVSLKFVGTKGSISNIRITTEVDNEYIRTTLSDKNGKSISGSYVKFLLTDLYNSSP